jgi:hypothetical protein
MIADYLSLGASRSQRSITLKFTDNAFVMRLLRTNDNGTLSHAEFVEDVPPCVILPHTWGKEEVTLNDITI